MVFGAWHRARISGVPHRLAPLIHDAGTDPFVDMRHRSTPGDAGLLPASTGQRYALARRRVKPPSNHRPPACGWRLAAGAFGLLPSPSPSFPGTAGPPRSRPAC